MNKKGNFLLFFHEFIFFLRVMKLHRKVIASHQQSLRNASVHAWLEQNSMSANNKRRAEMLSSSSNILTEKFPKDIDWGKCYPLEESLTSITTADELANFDFQPEWMKTKEYWDNDFETRYEKQREDPQRQPLKIILVPHSHNDPGWLKTFVNYFQSDSRQILNYVITQMDKDYKNMTFIWSEISFLQMWWDQAHPIKQRVSVFFFFLRVWLCLNKINRNSFAY